MEAKNKTLQAISQMRDLKKMSMKLKNPHF